MNHIGMSHLQLTSTSSQRGEAYTPLTAFDLTQSFELRYQMYTGDGTGGADGQCASVGGPM